MGIRKEFFEDQPTPHSLQVQNLHLCHFFSPVFLDSEFDCSFCIPIVILLVFINNRTIILSCLDCYVLNYYHKCGIWLHHNRHKRLRRVMMLHCWNEEDEEAWRSVQKWTTWCPSATCPISSSFVHSCTTTFGSTRLVYFSVQQLV